MTSVRFIMAVAVLCAAPPALAGRVFVTERADFSGQALPAGWSRSGGVYTSPAYSNTVTAVALSYAAALSGPSSARLLAFGHGRQDGQEVATLSAISDSAMFGFQEVLDFRRFQIDASDGFLLKSFSATWFYDPILTVSGSAILKNGYRETFDGITNFTEKVWANGVTCSYWQARNNGEEVTSINSKTATGRATASANSGGLYCCIGKNKSVESHSLGAVANTKNNILFGFAVTNDTEGTLTDFNLSFSAIQWSCTTNRKSSQSLRFAYLVTNELVSISTADNAWTEIDSLRFDAISVLDGSATFTDSEIGGISAGRSAALEEVRLQPGDVLLLRWRPDAVSNAELLGIDDVTLTCDFEGGGTVIHLVRTSSPLR